MKFKALAWAITAVVIVTPSPSATAAPNCDPTTSDGYLACMGGGIPWQNQDGSSSDTYGALGPRGFLAENRKMGVLSGLPDDKLLAVGYAICEELMNGKSDKYEKAVLMQNGVPDAEAGAAVTIARMYLCS